MNSYDCLRLAVGYGNGKCPRGNRDGERTRIGQNGRRESPFTVSSMRVRARKRAHDDDRGRIDDNYVIIYQLGWHYALPRGRQRADTRVTV